MILSLVLVLGLAFNIGATNCDGHGHKAKAGMTVDEAHAAAAAPTTASFAGVKLDCKEICPGHEGKCEFLCLDIKGMTCGGCEKSVTTALGKVDGVVKVVKVDHKEACGLVCYDPDKVKSEKIVATISELGYETKVHPDIKAAGCAHSGTAAKSCAKTCMMGKMKKCPSAKTATTTETKAETKTATE